MSVDVATVAATAGYEAHLRTEVAALQAEHGEAHLQRLLQQDIAACKKRESELALALGRVKTASEEMRRLQEAIRKTSHAREKTATMCDAIEGTSAKREALTASMAAEMAANRAGYKARIQDRLADIRAGVAEREEKVVVVEAENAELEKALEEHKTKFEAFYNKFQGSLQDRTSTFEELLGGCQQTAQELETVQSRLMLARRERNATEAKTATLEKQLQTYESQFETFASATVKPEDVAALAAKQQEQAHKRIADLEAQKAEANQLRLQFDKETTEMRAKLAALKRELLAAEKAKAAAEKKCRLAQEKSRQKSA